MDKLPFTVYDFFAYLSSGSVLVATVDYVFGDKWVLKEHVPPAFALIMLFVSYVCGHAIASVAAPLLEALLVGRTLKKPVRTLMGETGPAVFRRLFPGYYKPLPAETRERLEKQATSRGFAGSGESLFLHVFAVVTRDTKAQERLDQFRNLYGFARNMSLSLLASAVLLAIGTRVSGTPSTYLWSGLAALLGVTLFYRYLKFFRQYSYELLIRYAELDPLPEARR